LLCLEICGRYPPFEIAVLAEQGKFPKCTLVHELHMAFQVPYIYDYIMKLFRQQRSYKIIKMQMIVTLEQVKPNTENIRGLSLAVVKHTTVQASRQQL
jgi:hypothetical protein